MRVVKFCKSNLLALQGELDWRAKQSSLELRRLHNRHSEIGRNGEVCTSTWTLDEERKKRKKKGARRPETQGR